MFAICLRTVNELRFNSTEMRLAVQPLTMCSSISCSLLGTAEVDETSVVDLLRSTIELKRHRKLYRMAPFCVYKNGSNNIMGALKDNDLTLKDSFF